MAISFQGAPLYKRTSTGKIQFWRIFSRMNEMVVTYGHVDGKQQTTVETIDSGKNEGKANATTPEQQAYREAEARHLKQLKKGYVTELEAAARGEVDAVIAGGMVPMTAHRFDDHSKKVIYPAFVQPKLDGHRCVAIVMDGKATLWTREREPITGVPHVITAIEAMMVERKISDIVLDGELFHPTITFQVLSSFLRSSEPQEGHEAVEYHIYDIANDKEQLHRTNYLNNEVFDGVSTTYGNGTLKLVPTKIVDNENELMEAFRQFRNEGQEGLMVRNIDGKYVNKRSYDLQKVKSFDSNEFKIINVREGRGKMAGKAIFICKTATGVEFDVKMKGKLEDLVIYWNNPSLVIGRYLEVQHQGFTSDGALRFPVGYRFRDDIQDKK